MQRETSTCTKLEDLKTCGTWEGLWYQLQDVHL